MKNVFFGRNDISHIINNAPSLRNKLLTVTKQRKHLSLSFRQRMEQSPPKRTSQPRQASKVTLASNKPSSPRLDKEQMNNLLRSNRNRTGSRFFAARLTEEQKKPPALRLPPPLSARQSAASLHPPSLNRRRSSRNLGNHLNQEASNSTRSIFAKLVANRFDSRQPSAQCLPRAGETTLATDRQLLTSRFDSSRAEGRTRTAVSRPFRVKVQDRQWRRTHYF